MRKALVVVDYQNDFVSGSLGSADAAAIERPLFERVERAFGDGEDVYFTKDTHGPDYLQTDEGRHIPVVHCQKGTEGWEIYGSLKPLAEKAQVYLKPVFGSRKLADHLVSVGYDEVEVCGVATNICVIANAVLIKNAMPETRVVVDPRLVASYDRALGDAALKVMASLCIDIRQ